MNELITYAQIDASRPLPQLVPVEAGIWQCVLYATGKVLGFMKKTYNEEIINVNNVIIDYRELTQYKKLEDLRGLPFNKAGWVNKGELIYIRFYNFSPPLLFTSFKYGKLFGFTNGSPKLIDGIMYRPGLKTTPAIEQSADALTYDKMKFNSASISIDNTNGQFDNVSDLFGNEFNVFVEEHNDTKIKNNENVVLLIDQEEKEQLIIRNADTEKLVVLSNDTSIKSQPLDIAQYYISNITAKLNEAVFHLKDKRERLSAQLPDEKYLVENSRMESYPMIEDKYIDKDKQEAYGYCFGVPGVCLEGKRINSNQPQFRYRFSGQISRVDRIQVKMKDAWTTVYQRKKPSDTAGSTADNWSDPYPRWGPAIIPGSGPPATSIPKDTKLLEKGEITLHYLIAKQDSDISKGMNEVRMDGVFNNPRGRDVSNVNEDNNEAIMPLDIIEDIMWKYADVPFPETETDYNDSTYYDAEIVKELGKLTHKIGILYDKKISVYEAIEKLQSGGVFGFQFHVYKNKFTARLDDPNREQSSKLGIIKSQEILNLDEVEIDWNADLYGTHTDIEYAHNYSEDSGRHFIDTDNRGAIMEIHKVEKVWEACTLLVNDSDANIKSNLLLKDFSELCPLIKNIQLFGIKWFELRIYDIVEIDFSVPGETKIVYPRNLMPITKTLSDSREFAGSKLRCQILKIGIDVSTGITSIDVRVRGE